MTGPTGAFSQMRGRLSAEHLALAPATYAAKHTHTHTHMCAWRPNCDMLPTLKHHN